jgi:hypothetical protein
MDDCQPVALQASARYVSIAAVDSRLVSSSVERRRLNGASFYIGSSIGASCLLSITSSNPRPCNGRYQSAMAAPGTFSPSGASGRSYSDSRRTVYGAMAQDRRSRQYSCCLESEVKRSSPMSPMGLDHELVDAGKIGAPRAGINEGTQPCFRLLDQSKRLSLVQFPGAHGAQRR